MKKEIKQRIEQIRCGEVPEGYRRTKVGVIPNEWELCTISDCLEKVDNPVSVESDTVYTQIGIRSHGKGLFYKEPVKGKELGNKSVFWIEPNCFVLNIVFAWEQAFGKTTNNEIGMIASHRFPMYRPVNGSVNLDYLIYYFLTKRGTDVLDAASPGGAGRNRTLGQDRFAKSKIIVPPLHEQKKIAEILALQDRVIELKEKLVEEKKYYVHYLIGSLVTGKRRLYGTNSKWKQEQLGDFLTESKIVADSDIKKRITVKLNRQGIVKREIKTVEKEDATTQYVRKAGQFIYGKQNLHKGAFGIVPDYLDGYQSSSDLPSFDVSSEIDINWIYYWFSRESYYEYLEKIASGSGSKRVHPDEFLKINILVPPLDEQKRLVEILSKAEREVFLLQEDLEQEKQKKKALMQLLLTGIVRV